jgi:hypothetical protein
MRVIGGGAALLVGGGVRASVHPPRRGFCTDADGGPRADPAYAWYSDRDVGPGADPISRPPDNLVDGDIGPNSDHRPLARIGRCPAKPRPQRTNGRSR